jgi:NADH-quinone oxidoreductase subunit F
MSKNMNLEIVSKSDYIICLGSMISKDSPSVNKAILEAIAKNEAEFIYLHPIDDIDLKLYCTQFMKYEVGSEEGVLALLLEYFTKDRSDVLEEYLAELDIGYISAESSAGEEEYEEMVEKSLDKSNKTIIFGEDLFTHERVDNILSMIKAFKEFSGFNVVLLADVDLDSTKELEDVAELKSYNGTVIYKYNSKEDDKFVYGSESFSRVAKIADKDAISLNYGKESIKRVFKLDKNLQGTIALCGVKDEDKSFLSQGYRYKQVKIEKVDA